MTITQLSDQSSIPYELLLLADPSREIIDTYIFDSRLFIATAEGETIGCYVLSQVDQATVEIRNIAVREPHQRKGIGKLLLADAIRRSKLEGFQTIVIGTGNSSLGQLYLYQKSGFRISAIRPDFFTQRYKEKIIENGIECRDMIVLSREL